MKRTKALALLLALTLAAGLFPAAPPALAMTKAPVARPPAVIKPPIVKPPIIANPLPGGGSTQPAPQKGLFLAVDKEGRKGEIRTGYSSIYAPFDLEIAAENETETSPPPGP